jgi:hypothetical protein
LLTDVVIDSTEFSAGAEWPFLRMALLGSLGCVHEPARLSQIRGVVELKSATAPASITCPHTADIADLWRRIGSTPPPPRPKPSAAAGAEATLAVDEPPALAPESKRQDTPGPLFAWLGVAPVPAGATHHGYAEVSVAEGQSAVVWSTGGCAWILEWRRTGRDGHCEVDIRLDDVLTGVSAAKWASCTLVIATQITLCVGANPPESVAFVFKAPHSHSHTWRLARPVPPDDTTTKIRVAFSAYPSIDDDDDDDDDTPPP